MRIFLNQVVLCMRGWDRQTAFDDTAWTYTNLQLQSSKLRGGSFQTRTITDTEWKQAQS